MTDPGHVFFHQCPVCGEKATVPGVTDHECDPDRPAGQIIGFLTTGGTESRQGAGTLAEGP